MQDSLEPDWRARIQPKARAVETSGIVEVFDYGRNVQGLIPLWVGEGDLPTPTFIREAAKASIDAGETFYTYQAGVPKLRSAISRYMSAHYGGDLPPERFFVTIGGMHALDIAVKLTVGPAEEAIVLAPAWPNFAGALASNGARAVFVELEAGASWRLDPTRLEAAITPLTRAILFNSPANPTGYVATQPAAYETPVMKTYIQGFPQAAVARDQLKYAVSEITVHDGQRIMKVFNDNLQAAITGGKTAEVAMKDAQAEADKILKEYK